ncbi:glycosyltransferase family 2 protein [Epilithonimonas zeae]|nr:glycosyltransferase [Epilithonimonas zeae]
MKNNSPMLSVIMITYGQERYISKAIEGVFLQKTNFPVELIISNDASPDNTDEIINRIVPSAPANISVKYIKHIENLGPILNFQDSLNKAKGKYIAVCEGDDYWIDSNKLQFQVDFLEKNPEISLSYHRVKYLRNDEEIILPHHEGKNEVTISNIENLSKINYINTPSVVFRNNLVHYDTTVMTSKIGDYPLWMLLAEKGNIIYFPNIFAVYREGVGIQSSLSKTKQLETTNEMLFLLTEYFSERNNVLNNLENQIYNNKKKLEELLKRENYFFNILFSLKESFIYYKRKFF